MKSIFKCIFCTSLWMIGASMTFSQQRLTTKNKLPGWLSDKGFWQIESNIHSPDHSIVYFYTNEHVLVYKEHLQGLILDLTQKRTKMRLKKALEGALTARAKNCDFKYDQQLISKLFKKR